MQIKGPYKESLTTKYLFPKLCAKLSPWKCMEKDQDITVIQVSAPTSNAEEDEVERFYEDLQDLLELTHKKDVFFI